MKHIIFFSRIIFFLFSVSYNSYAAENSDDTVHQFSFGISAVNFAGLNKNDTSASLKAWTHAIIDEEKFNLSLQIDLFDSFEELNHLYAKGEIDAASINVEEFMQLSEKPDNIYIPSYDNSPFIRYALIAKKGDRDDTIDKVFNGRLAFHDSPRMIYAIPWLQLHLSKKLPTHEHLLQIDSLKQLVHFTDTPAKAIFEVFFQQADTALIRLETFEIACELNPQLTKELEIIATSPNLITAMFLLRPSFQETYRQQLENYLVEMHTTVAGKQVLTTFQSEKITRYPAHILQTTEELITDYHQFLNR